MSSINKCISEGCSSYPEMSMKRFVNAKTTALQGLDLSKKGSVDVAILDIVELLNACSQYFTTSSCSGRTIIVADSCDKVIRKKGCEWLYVTHEQGIKSDVMASLHNDLMPYTASLKFEPMIMHVQCWNIESARQLLQVAVACGYRNSGITIGKSGKIILAVRSTAGMEVPLIAEHNLLVTEQYVEFLVNLANEKMRNNHLQIARFAQSLKETKFSTTVIHKRKEEKKRALDIHRDKQDKAGEPVVEIEEYADSCHDLFGT